MFDIRFNAHHFCAFLSLLFFSVVVQSVSVGQIVDSDSQEHIEQDVITCNYKHQLSMQLLINSSLHSIQIYGSIRPRVSASILLDQAFFQFAENPYLNLNTQNSRFQIFRIAIQSISVGQIVDCDSQEHSEQDVITCNCKHQLSICNSPLIALFITHKYMD